jgi:hypothetical protein
MSFLGANGRQMVCRIWAASDRLSTDYDPTSHFKFEFDSFISFHTIQYLLEMIYNRILGVFCAFLVLSAPVVTCLSHEVARPVWSGHSF